MKLKIYKGFDIAFYSNLNEESLINKDILDRIDVRKFDKKYSDLLQIAIIQMDGEYWITYEEYSLVKGFIEQRCLSGDLEIVVIKNNIYPDIYPISYNISNDIIDEIEDNNENKESENLSEITKKITSIYSNLVEIDGQNYVTYYNDEIDNEAVSKVELYYNNKLDIIDGNEKVDYIISITNDLEDFIHNINIIKANNFQTIGIEINCDTITSRKICDAYRTFCYEFKNNTKLIYYSEKLIEKKQIIKRFEDIAKEVIKIPHFSDFRYIEFYENIDLSRDTVKISQQNIMYDIVNEAIKANNGEYYRDIFVTAPTGSGKSVMFQIPAIYLSETYNKLTIIIEPIKGLMEDQKDKLDALGYKHAAFLNSDIATAIEKEKIIERVKTGDINLLYLSPETLLSYTIETIIGDRDIGLIVVDEAHIVTTWGVGFRPDYWYLGSYIDRLRNSINKNKYNHKEYKFPICTFTATAICGGKDDTFKETALSLHLKSPIRYIGNLRRNNIKFEIYNYPEKLGRSEYETKKVEILGSRMYNWTENNNKTIIYFPYHRLAQELYDGVGIFRDLDVFKDCIGIYTGQSDKEIKLESMNKFANDQKCIMAATKAFGMGIDINNVENVYHYAVSGNLSDYVQEIGRVARKEGMIGHAITDYFENDKMYMNQLFGMSQIRHYQVSKVLQIIYDVYKNKKNRNFLITPKMFFGIFGKDEDKASNRLKIILLMLEKDLYEKFSFKVLISRPRSIFTHIFVAIDREREQLVLNGEYGKYFKFYEKGRFKSPNPDGSFTTDFGDIYKIDLKSLWEENYENMSFASFKHDFFSNYNSVCPNLKPYIRSRIQVKLNTNNGLTFQEMRNKLYEDINFIIDKIREFKREYFTVLDFAKKLEERFGIGLKQKLIANSFLETVDENRESYKVRVDENGVEHFVISNSSIETKIHYLIKNCQLLMRLRFSDQKEYSCFLANDRSESNIKAFRLLSLLDLATYELLGGDNPEIFIRLNDPEKIRKIVSRQIYYSNDYVDNAREKHLRSVRTLDYFFRNLSNDEERWNFIEDYFAGEDVTQNIELNVGDEIIYRDLKSSIDVNQSYSLEKYKKWNEIELFFDNEYLPVIKKLSTLNIRIPNYATSKIKINEYKFDAVMVWTDKNIIVLNEECEEVILDVCRRIGWTVYKISNINYSELTTKMEL